ncbi:hypothetical protein BGZ94_005433, partial [Podila epigama]
MHHAHAAPIYHAPSLAGQPLPAVPHQGPSQHQPTHIETIHMPHHGPAPSVSHHGPSHHQPTHIETIHQPYHGPVPTSNHTTALPHAVAATTTSAPAPSHVVSHHPHTVVLGKSYDEPIKQDTHDLAPVQSHKDGAGLHPSSYPSHHVAPNHASATPTAAHLHKTHEPIHKAAAPKHGQPHVAEHAPKKKKKLSKRERKAAKKHEIASRMGVLGTISTALVGRRKNSVSSPILRLNEIFGEPDGPVAAPAQGSVAAGIGGIRHLLESIHMPAIMTRHAADHHEDKNKVASHSAHDVHVAGNATHKHIPSKAVTLKSPKLDLSHFPEEDASYPRGDVRKHENPAHPKSVANVTEIRYRAPVHASDHVHATHIPTHAPSHAPSHAPAAVVQAPAVHAHAHAAPAHEHAHLGRIVLDLHEHHPEVTHHPQHKHSSTTAHDIHPQHKHSHAVALKKPTIAVGSFSEEEPNYPRGDYHRMNRPAGPTHKPVAVREIQLDNAHRHGHHDLHLSLGETAAAAVGTGVGTLMSAIGGIHMPELPHVTMPELPHITMPELPHITMPELPHAASSTPAHKHASEHSHSKVPLARMILDLNEKHPEVINHPQHMHSNAAALKAHPQHEHSKAVALKKPAIAVGSFPEEEP